MYDEDEQIAVRTGQWPAPSLKRENDSPDFNRITEEDLRDNNRLSVLYAGAVTREFWKNDENAVLAFWGFAEKALEEDKWDTPGKLFYSLIKEKKFDQLWKHQQCRAADRMRQTQRQTLVAQVKESLRVKASTDTRNSSNTEKQKGVIPKKQRSGQLTPPDRSIAEEPKQMELFRQFYKTAEASELSNTIELWDAIPKYYCDKKQQNLLRTTDGFLPTLKRSFQLRPSVPLESGRPVDAGVIISPAPLLQPDGSDKAFYPGEKEELVESVLRKFFVDQKRDLGVYDRKNGDSWVFFSLSSIREELKQRGHSANYKQIKESIDILSSSVTTLLINGEEVYRDTIISSLTRVNRGAYELDPKALWSCRLPGLISSAIENGMYMQYDYATDMDCKTSLSRWLHKYLSRRWKQAGGGFWYDLRLSTVERDTGFFKSGKTKDNRRKMERSISELIEKNIIKPSPQATFVYDKNDKRKIIDISYRIFATESFGRKMRASNKRLKQHLQELEKLQ